MHHPAPLPSPPHGLPTLLDATEVGTLLRTSRAAVYTLAERGLAGAFHRGRRLLFDQAVLLRWLSKRRDLPGAEYTALPVLLTPTELATVLRTTRAAVYASAERGQLPGVLHVGRRLLFDQADLLRWLSERRAASPGIEGR